jgi:hypothetical protein
MRPTAVTIEDRFVNATRATPGYVAAVWRVVQLFEGGDGVRYARLVNAVDRSLTKTVAAGALLDRSLFRHAG